MEAKTEGRVKVKYHHSAVLGKPMDFVKMVGGKGVADMGLLISVFHQWELPLFAGIHLPFLYTGVETPVRKYMRLYEEWAPMREEWVKHNIRPLWLYVSDPYYMLLNKPISKLDDLKGDKIYGPGGFAGIVKRFGAAPTFIPGPEAYEALQRGVLDGLAFPFSPIYSFRFYEVRKVFIDFTFVGAQAGAMMVINQDVWNKISPKDQKAIEEISAEMSDYYIKRYRETLAYLMDYFKSKGNTFISLSPEEEARVRERCAQEMWDEWVKTAEQKGVPAGEFLKRFKAID
ncbi:MAG: TRAP transporter substrate-binding protein DctP [Deltaproteobacteria bacterium]|nr:MAG: TRAP transporter substrate-binding protein DctP [Deltaproteobacteria bacterium]